MIIKIIILLLLKVFLFYYLIALFVGAGMVFFANSKESMLLDPLGIVGVFLAIFLLPKIKHMETKEERKLLESFRPRLL